ncbi:MAG: phosphoglycerate kinase [Crenarchaeota archaeon]|nr:phosphoglycerate kinase [Thermoproteota archaeon]
MEVAKFLELVSKVPRFEDLKHEGKKVLVRVDINVPLDKSKSQILDDFRIYAHAQTIRKLVDLDCAVVIIAHQGRPGDKEFSSLEAHSKVMSRYVGQEVKFIDDIIGPAAREEIRKLKNGEILMLENVRFLSEETLERSPEEHSNSYLVRKLWNLFDEFILDAFAAIHRSHASIVGFTCKLPSCMGLILQKEIDALKYVLQSDPRNTLIIAGGSKIPDTVKVIAKILERNIADKIVTGGLVSTVFTAAKHGASGWIKEFIESKKLQEQVETARKLLDKYSDRIITPLDHVVLRKDGTSHVVDVKNVNDEIVDIGPKTLDLYKDLVAQYENVIMTGPVGWIENEEFAKGTVEILMTMISKCKFTAIGGGHTVMIARKLGLLDKISHVSTGGRAFLYTLAGEELPGLVALAKSRELFSKTVEPGKTAKY